MMIMLQGNYKALYLSKLNLYIMNRGTVKFFNDSKGFGFITDEESNKEYFDLEEGRKGLNAVNVRQA